ncbi:outer membrane protein [Bartonella schoenbuchensis]|uniref:Hemin binding protein C n=1 Tax=Bartonella schoenbuchensis (strain DSM 13525 / NCTC 13165 / R1) TaxID=687861 RepID=E6YXW5_BARSR|nr:outer membrane protein [Bartonella schoenbuchensis]AQX30139.1 outer membrane immunogenic protein [Bartonella schoenbuchensis R1]CBI81703.1 Hemin binding protein C [Bartonella schoenbuchensis R1]
MNMKCVITASIFALVSASAAQAADMPVQERPTTVLPQVVVAPAFSWTGFYLGGQIGGFSSNSSWVRTSGDIQGILGHNKAFPKFSGFVGGLYAGSNVDFGNGFVLGVDTDIVWSGAKAKASRSSLRTGNGARLAARAGVSTRAPALFEGTDNNASRVTESVTFSDKWSGATRVRLGFAFDRIMPYVAGGIAYSQIKAVVAEERQGVETVIEQLSGSKTLVGYTLGAGVDFAMTDSVILRAEYRYSDFGKKSFISNNAEIDLKTNDFRVGVAYKF